VASRFAGSLLGNLTSKTDLDADDDFRRSENRNLKNIYVFGLTIVCLFGVIVLTLFSFEGAVAEEAVKGLIGLVELTVIFFLSTTTIDRSEVLTNIGKGVRARAEQPTIVVQTPEEALAAAGAKTTVTTTGSVIVDPAKPGDDQSVG
jgi:hypothetical protein